MPLKRRKRSYAPKTPVSVKSRGYKQNVVARRTLADAFAEQGQGTTKFEKAVDGAAKSIGIRFDAYQYFVALNTALESTRIDFVIFNPLTAIYADGIQHELRPDTAQQDLIRRIELEGRGWKVVAITERDFLINPIGEVAKILWA